MRLLFVTQVMDKEDAVLGAYHGWVAALARYAESITVICLYEGAHDLPQNVKVLSLGKDRRTSPSWVYAIRFICLAWQVRREYDAVFVHMNQEYLLIAGPLWKIIGKRMYLWRNHYAGSWLTDLSAAFCTKVFCTSARSYTAKYRKTILMPVGVDTERFHPDGRIPRKPHSILFLARIAPSKRPDILIEALGLLIRNGVSFVASIYGSPLPSHTRYYESLKQRAEELGLSGRVEFHPSVPNARTPDLYRAHHIFVNCSPPGMFDKTLFEAAACGALPLAATSDYPESLREMLTFPVGDIDALKTRISALLALPPVIEARIASQLSTLVASHSLEALIHSLVKELSV